MHGDNPTPPFSRVQCSLRLVARLAVIVAAVLTVSPARAQDEPKIKPTDKPLLWVIEAKTPSYLYGTIHVPDERVLAVPEVVEEAVNACDVFYTEIPMDMASLMAAAGKMMLPGEQTLADVLPPKLYERTDKYLQSKGSSLGPLSKFKVWAVVVQVSLADYIQEMASKVPLDMALYQQASAGGKEVGGIETVDEQIAVFESFSAKEQLQALANTLDLLEKAEKEGKSHARELVASYLHGDENELLKIMHEDLDLDDPVDRKMFAKLITERNKLMARRVAEKIKERPDKSFCFALGAGHLGGKDGVVKLLESQGFKLRRLTPADAGKLPSVPLKKGAGS